MTRPYARKPGVTTVALQERMISFLETWYPHHNEIYVTAGNNGTHAAGSYHYGRTYNGSPARAIDLGAYNDPAPDSKDQADMGLLADWLYANFWDLTCELIHCQPQNDHHTYVKNQKRVAVYAASAHVNHVHWATSDALLSKMEARAKAKWGIATPPKEAIQVSWLKGCDFSFDKPDLPQLWSAGYRVILIYLSDSAKGFSNAYAKQALDIGFKILPLYETTAGAALGGYDTGVAHAKFATAKAKAQGIPSEVDIIYALDQDFSTAQLAGPVSEYVRGLHSVPGDDALYGGYNQLAYLKSHGKLNSDQNFQTYAWSGGRWLPIDTAPIEQYHNGVKVAGGTVDDCRVQDNLVFWEKDMATAAEIWAADVIPAAPENKDNPNWQAKNALADCVLRIREVKELVKALPKPPTKEDIAAAVVAALPPAATGGLTEAQVTTAVLSGLEKLKISVE